MEKRERVRIFWVPRIISETGKARTLNFVRTFIGSIRIKAHENFGESIVVGA